MLLFGLYRKTIESFWGQKTIKLYNITNKGTKYLAESIVAVYRDRNKALHLTKLYKDIAKKNNTTWQAVERIMRNEVKKVSDNKLGEFILRQAIIIKQKKKERAKK